MPASPLIRSLIDLKNGPSTLTCPSLPHHLCAMSQFSHRTTCSAAATALPRPHFPILLPCCSLYIQRLSRITTSGFQAVRLCKHWETKLGGRYIVHHDYCSRVSSVRFWMITRYILAALTPRKRGAPFRECIFICRSL